MEDVPIIHTGLLGVLLRADGPMTVESLGLACGLTRTQTLAELDRLRAAGCRLDEHPQRGLRLMEAGLATWRDMLRAADDRQRIIEVYRETSSTQDICRRLLQGSPSIADRAVAVADVQSAGRGRLGRRWIAPPGTAVTFSEARLLTNLADHAAVDRLTFAGCVGAARAVESLLGGERVTLKWPNDIYVRGRKIAGILVETLRVENGGNVGTSRGRAPLRFAAKQITGETSGGAIIGVGINVNLKPEQLPDDPALRERITSFALCGRRVDRLRVLLTVIHALDEALDRTPLVELLEHWRQRCTMLGHDVVLCSGGRRIEGQVVDLDPYEGLIVRRATGELVHLPAAVTTVEGAV